MPKPSFKAQDRKFRGYLRGQAWCLCVGAGISKGIVPDWQEVSLRLLNKSFSISMSDASFEALRNKTRWALDSWIQTALNNYLQNNKTTDEFNELLEEILYEDLLNTAANHNLHRAVARAFND